MCDKRAYIDRIRLPFVSCVSLHKRIGYGLFIYQASGVLPGPSRVSDRQVNAENVIYEAFAFCGKLDGASFTAFLG